MHTLNKIIAVILLIFILNLCSQSNPVASESSRIAGFLANYFSAFDAKPMLKNISENILFTTYSSFSEKMKSLQTNCTTQNWKEAILTLRQTEMINFGYSQVYSNLDPWPSNYQNPTSIQSSGNHLARSEFWNICSTSIATQIYTEAAKLAYNWNPINPSSFSVVMQTAGSSNEFYKSDKEVTDKLISSLSSILEKMKDDKIGYPAGLSTDAKNALNSGTSKTTLLNSVEYKAVSGLNIDLLKSNMSGIRKIYTGDGGVGISAYVRYYNTGLDDRILLKMNEIDATLLSLSDLSVDINSNSAKVTTLYTQLSDFRKIFTVELAGNLGSTFSPTSGGGDGD